MSKISLIIVSNATTEALDLMLKQTIVTAKNTTRASLEIIIVEGTHKSKERTTEYVAGVEVKIIFT